MSSSVANSVSNTLHSAPIELVLRSWAVFLDHDLDSVLHQIADIISHFGEVFNLLSKIKVNGKVMINRYCIAIITFIDDGVLNTLFLCDVIWRIYT